MLGNDIVDLRDADARPESFRGRFDQRVFSEEELRVIAQDETPLARRWAHWGAKEAAYKLARQMDSWFVFSPLRLVACYLEGDVNQPGDGMERRGTLELPRAFPQGIRKLALRSYETAERVHVVASPFDADWGGVEMAVETIDGDRNDPSQAVRTMAIREISRRHHVDARRLTIGREGRIPRLRFDGSRIPVSLSLSHHGIWISYAMRSKIDAFRPRLGTTARTGFSARAAGIS